MRKQIIQFKKRAKDLNKYFGKENNTDGKQAHKKVLNTIGQQGIAH